MKETSKSRYLTHRVHVQTLTWARESNGLFDYESRNLHKKSFVARRTSRLIRIGNDCQLKDEDYEFEAGQVTGLCWLMEYDSDPYSDGFLIKAEQNSDKLWMVVTPAKHVKAGQGYALSEGDLIRLGRVGYLVKQVCPTGKEKPEFAVKCPPKSQAVAPSMGPEGEKIPCRICLSDTQTEDDPLISPCKCAGTMKFIHLKCLREWLQSRLNIKQSGSIVSYYWKSLDCELCKENLPSKILLNGELLELVDIHKPNTPFIVLEETQRERERDSSLGIHVLSMPLGATVNLVTFTQGRGHESDIRIQDISVSRLHASIHLSDNLFRISDRRSKFGTLVQVQRWIALYPGINLSLQVSRTVVNIRMKRETSFASIMCMCCLKTPQILPTVGEMTIAEKLYEVNERSGQFEDGSFSHLLAHPLQELRLQLPDGPALIAQDFVEGEERPTTRARTAGEGSQILPRGEIP